MNDSHPLAVRKTKRRRLNFACNYCRARKTRCDEQKPSCHACVVAGVACVTTDRRRPGVSVNRREAGESSSLASAIASGDGSGLAVADASVSSSDPPTTPVRTAEPTSAAAAAAEPKAGAHAHHLRSRSLPSDGSEGVRRFRGKLPLVPRLAGSSTIDLLIGWLDLAFHRLDGNRGFMAGVNASPCDSPPVGLPQATCSLQLPSASDCRRLTAAFFSDIDPIFPVVSRTAVEETLWQATAASPDTGADSEPDILILYLVLSLGALAGGTDVQLAGDCVSRCRTALGHAVECRTLASVKMTFLLSVALRRRDQLASSWSVLSLCVSMAQVLNLDRQLAAVAQSSAGTTGVPARDLAEPYRLWWSIYAFEKILALEYGRPSMIKDVESNHDEPVSSLKSPDQPDMFVAVVSLARILSQVNERSIRARRQEEGSGRNGLQRAIFNKVRTTGELVLLLMEWADGLPEGLRMRPDMICISARYSHASFLYLQYHNACVNPSLHRARQNALLTLLRNSLLISEEAISDVAGRIATGQPWDEVVRSGQSISANAARNVVRSLVAGAEQGVQPLFATVWAPLHALSVLSVYLITHPESRLANSDLDLMENAASLALSLWHALGLGDPRKLQHTTQILQARAAARVAAVKQNPKATAATATAPEVIDTAVPRGADRTPQASRLWPPAANTGGTAPSPAEGFPPHGSADAAGGLSTISPALEDSDSARDMAIEGLFFDCPALPVLPDEVGWDWADVTQLL